jgi:uncharacterized 2Fe-2S/4Fe-4S cluster protein (DUF4445 family)
MSKEVQITFQPQGRRAKVKLGTSIFEVARGLGIEIESLCGGNGICGKCKVIVKGQSPDGLTEAERKLLTEEEISRGYRLACCAKLTADVIVTVPEEARIGKQRLQIEGVQKTIALSPAIRKLMVKVSPPSLLDQSSDFDRLLYALRTQHNLADLEVEFSVLKDLPHTLRESNWVVTVTLFGNRRIIDVEPGVALEDSYGVAVDIGTTKIASYLVGLNNGRTIHASAAMNPQIPFGEDVITRITYAQKDFQNLKELQAKVIQEINAMIKEHSEKTNVKPRNIYEIAIVGNTAMHHLFLGLNPKFVALSPFVPVIQGSYDVKASSLNLNINPNANVYILPVIAGFVGADSVADILATEIYKSKKLSLLIDVGTNTEIIIGNRDGLAACSCASGPAFEGVHIKHGMRASSGAIERVKIDPETLEVSYKTIDNKSPIGICGSALIDAVAEMYKTEIIDSNGKINSNLKSVRIRKGEDGVYEYVLAWQKETLTRDIVITQKDIRELQLAKAAIYVGAYILMKKIGIKPSEIEQVFIAGAFGNYIDPENAQVIGMYPKVPLDKVKFCGNAAGVGARIALLSEKTRKIAEKISEKVKYIELAAEPSFQSEFIKAMYIPHKEAERFK